MSTRICVRVWTRKQTDGIIDFVAGTDGQTNRQTDKQTDEQTDRWTGRQTDPDRQMDGLQTHNQIAPNLLLKNSFRKQAFQQKMSIGSEQLAYFTLIRTEPESIPVF